MDLGTGVRTALAQIAADELDLPMHSVTIVQGDTALTPDQGTTWGSLSIQIGGVQIRQAAAAARRALVEEAAAATSRQTGGIAGRRRRHQGPERRDALTYGALIGGKSFSITLDPEEAGSDQGPEGFRAGRQARAASRHPRQGDRPLHLYAGFSAARHAAWARRAPAGDRRDARKRR